MLFKKFGREFKKRNWLKVPHFKNARELNIPGYLHNFFAG